MSTIAETMAIMENMPEATRKQVLSFARYKLRASKPSNPSASFSDDELVSILEHSDAEYHDGKAMDMKKAILEARKMHGFI
ncbi:MAG: hypothetical protein SOI44_08240 [Lactimicrobium sp.]|jgi:hypothetical protein|uniref:hypothetical protein n=1 Tax=Lactimicrobium sp. TaxID=2563780 RepID=UPI002F354C46